MKGFTVIELIISVVILSLASVALFVILKNQLLGDLETTAQSIISHLSEAQNKALAGLEGKNWGIHFDSTTTPFYALFPGSSYTQASTTYFLFRTVEFQSPPLASSTNVVFNKLTGTVAATTTITIRLRTNTQNIKTITVFPQGRIILE